MTIKKITIGFRMADSVITDLYTQFPTILKYHEYGNDQTTLIVDITPAQEANVLPILAEKLVKIEDIPGGVWPPT